MTIHLRNPLDSKGRSLCPHGLRSFFAITVAADALAEMKRDDPSLKVCAHCAKAARKVGVSIA